MTSPNVKPDMDEARDEQPSEMPLKEEPQQEATEQQEVKQEEVKQEEVKREQPKQEEPKQEAAAEAKQEAAAAAPSDDEIKQRLAVLLQASDLATTTEKMLRKQLEGQLGVKLDDKKALIRQEVLDYLDKQQAEQGDGDEAEESNGSEEEEEEEQPKKRGGFHKEMLLSEAMQEFMGTERASRTEVVKAVWDHIKANELQNPKDRRQIIIDEKLGHVFTAPLTMFTVNKQISNHVFKPEDMVDGDEKAPPAAARSKPAPKRRAKKAASDDDDDDDAPKKKRPASGFAKPLPVSDELAAATGQKEMSRGAVTKWVFDYAKEHNLLDPSDKRFVVADETMQQLTGQKRFKAFGAISLLKQHFVKN